ncbi:hypothetical protein P7C71_g62, partial [Lecanoromycetidae sp. Uapishka_2]
MLSSFERPDINKRKRSVNGSRRDQPLRSSQHLSRSLYQPPDFMTDSLNPSHSPSLSPPKSLTRPAERARARQAFADSRRLASALKTKQPFDHEHQSPSSGSSSDRGRLQESVKRPTSYPPYDAIPSPPSSMASSPTRRKTPSPARGRRNDSVTSPVVSEPSPARGYAEAYQRIVDEEDLAQEESVEDMEEGGEYSFSQEGNLRDGEGSQLRSRNDVDSPISLRATRRASPRGAPEEPVLEPPDKDIYKQKMAHDSSSESGGDFSEDITGTSLDSGFSQHARDLARLNALTEGAKALGKARVGARVGLTVDKLRRRHESNESLHSAFNSGDMNLASESYTRIREVGDQKAKSRNNWLNRINNGSGRLTGDVFKRHSSGSQIIAESQNQAPEAPIDEEIACTAEAPLPNENQIPSKVRITPPRFSSSPALRQHGSLDNKRQWAMEDDEFTGRSLQVSQSPPLRIGNAPHDCPRERELETDEGSAEAIHESLELESEKHWKYATPLPRASKNIETPLVTNGPVQQAFELTPQDSQHIIDLKTPLITGAWIDTPLPTGGRGPPMPTPSDLDDTKEEANIDKFAASDLIHRLEPESLSARPKLPSPPPLKYSGSRLPKSVLEEILKDAKSPVASEKMATPLADLASEDDPTLHLDETIISDLGKLVANDQDLSTLPTSIHPLQVDSSLSASKDPLLSAPALSESSRTSRRLLRVPSYTSLLSRLTNLATSLCSSEKQIASLEQAISAPATSTVIQDTSDQNGIEESSSSQQCPSCGIPGQNFDLGFHFLYNPKSGKVSFALAFPRLWYWRKHDWRPRLTWLGWIIMLAYILINAESYARYRFCHKRYATHMVGYGVDINAPRPPFVLVKVLWRYAVVETSFFAIVRAIVRLLWGLVGYLVGFLGAVRTGDVGDLGNGGPRVGEQMMGDEYL